MQPRQIRILYLGGLGNQLFQYFAAVQISTSHGMGLVHDFSQIDSKQSHKDSDIRQFGKLFENQKLIKRGKTRILLDRVLTSLTLRFSWSCIFTKVISDYTLRDYKHPLKFRYSTTTMIGYFQSRSYFEEWSNATSFSLSKTNSRALKLSNSTPEWRNKEFVALHVRGGDFLISSSDHTTLSKEYYSSAIAIMFQTIPIKVPVVIFSNDREHAETRIGELTGFNIHYFDDKALKPSEVMTIMSSASGHIISNSTFSYWAARLSTSSKLVVCPEYDILAEELHYDYYPSGWKRIRVN